MACAHQAILALQRACPPSCRHGCALEVKSKAPCSTRTVWQRPLVGAAGVDMDHPPESVIVLWHPASDAPGTGPLLLHRSTLLCTKTAQVHFAVHHYDTGPLCCAPLQRRSTLLCAITAQVHFAVRHCSAGPLSCAPSQHRSTLLWAIVAQVHFAVCCCSTGPLAVCHCSIDPIFSSMMAFSRQHLRRSTALHRPTVLHQHGPQHCAQPKPLPCNCVLLPQASPGPHTQQCPCQLRSCAQSGSCAQAGLLTAWRSLRSSWSRRWSGAACLWSGGAGLRRGAVHLFGWVCERVGAVMEVQAWLFEANNLKVQANNLEVQANNLEVQANNLEVQANNLEVQANRPGVRSQ